MSQVQSPLLATYPSHVSLYTSQSMFTPELDCARTEVEPDQARQRLMGLSGFMWGQPMWPPPDLYKDEERSGRPHVLWEPKPQADQPLSLFAFFFFYQKSQRVKPWEVRETERVERNFLLALCKVWRFYLWVELVSCDRIRGTSVEVCLIIISSCCDKAWQGFDASVLRSEHTCDFLI